ncbi:rhomboid family intramembrane serine protease [Dyella jejuensis]|uniref:Rhomboid family intramembrane serine protease n=1 Tax=Dyella jejuensis TaxID=1432009 RepID=A0ABW8JL65_9GAMM
MHAPAETLRFERMTDVLRRTPCTTLWLVAIWVIFFVELITHAPGNQAMLMRLGALPVTGIVHGQYWRLLTYALLHSAWWHIGLNTLGLWICGPVVERALGPRATLVISVAGAILGGVAILLVHHNGPASIELGASGALFALLGAGLVSTWRRPGISLSSYRRLRAILIVGLAISFTPEVSMAAHLGGLASGMALAWMWRAKAALG